MTSNETHLEIEAKLLVKDLALIESRLAVMGASLRHERVFERNIRYDTPDQALTQQGIILRLREDDRVRLTFKGPFESIVEGLQTRFEAEVEVGDFQTMDLILKKLGFQPSMVYDKYRTSYGVRGAEVVLDQMPFGNFVEVEGSPEQIEAALTGLGLEQASRLNQSYAELFENVRVNLGLNFTDLTFENFAGIDVPPEAFQQPANAGE